jgi:hypothetical protein
MDYELINAFVTHWTLPLWKSLKKWNTGCDYQRVPGNGYLGTNNEAPVKTVFRQIRHAPKLWCLLIVAKERSYTREVRGGARPRRGVLVAER